MSGDPELDASQVLPDFDYAGYGQMIGVQCGRVDRPEDIGAAWDDALSASRSARDRVHTDPEVPPLPPHIQFEQVRELTHTLAQGDPASGRFVRNSLRGKLAEFPTR